PSQAKPSQAKPSQAKPNLIIAITGTVLVTVVLLLKVKASFRLTSAYLSLG
ncbi:MAG: hypothetical protein ACI93R_004133, partial [Flavobacteriales bacterium]